jgi:hypothetical protein
MSEWINLREERDFGTKFNATFQFARQNVKNLSLSLLLLGTPLMLASNLFVAYIQSDLQMNAMDYSSGLPNGFWYMYMILIPVYLLAYSWLMAVTYSYITEYLNGNRDITPGQVFKRTLKNIVKIVVAGIITTIITILAFFLLVIPGIYVAVAITFVNVIIIVEDGPVFGSISRSFSLIKGKWWSTFGLIFVMGLVAGIMQFAFAIPTYINVFTKTLHHNLFAFDAGTIISYAIASIGTTLLYPLVFIAIAFQYFNMVERHESRGLMNQIEMAGKQVETASKNEGEY